MVTGAADDLVQSVAGVEDMKIEVQVNEKADALVARDCFGLGAWSTVLGSQQLLHQLFLVGRGVWARSAK